MHRILSQSSQTDRPDFPLSDTQEGVNNLFIYFSEQKTASITHSASAAVAMIDAAWPASPTTCGLAVAEDVMTTASLIVIPHVVLPVCRPRQEKTFIVKSDTLNCSSSTVLKLFPWLMNTIYSIIIPVYVQLCEYSDYCTVEQSVPTKFPAFFLLLCKTAVMLLPLCSLVATLSRLFAQLQNSLSKISFYMTGLLF